MSGRFDLRQLNPCMRRRGEPCESRFVIRSPLPDVRSSIGRKHAVAAQTRGARLVTAARNDPVTDSTMIGRDPGIASHTSLSIHRTLRRATRPGSASIACSPSAAHTAVR